MIQTMFYFFTLKCNTAGAVFLVFYVFLILGLPNNSMSDLSPFYKFSKPIIQASLQEK